MIFVKQSESCVDSFDMVTDCPEITGHVLFVQLSCFIVLSFIVLP